MARLLFRRHAIQRMVERQVSVDDVHQALLDGAVIEAYAEDRPYPSRLVLAFIRLRPLHIVAALNTHDDEEIVVTVYEPDPALWGPGFRERLT